MVFFNITTNNNNSKVSTKKKIPKPKKKGGAMVSGSKVDGKRKKKKKKSRGKKVAKKKLVEKTVKSQRFDDSPKKKRKKNKNKNGDKAKHHHFKTLLVVEDDDNNNKVNGIYALATLLVPVFGKKRPGLYFYMDDRFKVFELTGELKSQKLKPNYLLNGFDMERHEEQIRLIEFNCGCWDKLGNGIYTSVMKNNEHCISMRDETIKTKQGCEQFDLLKKKVIADLIKNRIKLI